MKARRYMEHPVTERRIISAVVWFIAACVIAAVLMGCSPYAGTIVPNTATPSPITATVITSEKFTELKPTPTPPPLACTVTGYLNFRTRPSRSAAVIAVLESGERVQVIERGDWLKITTRNRTGYVYSKFCK